MVRAAERLTVTADPDGVREIAHPGTRHAACGAAPAAPGAGLCPGAGWRDNHRTGSRQALDLMDVDSLGLDDLDRRVLHTIIEKYNCGPVGLNTIAASIHEEQDTIKDVVEPYLLQLGFLERTSQGRLATRGAASISACRIRTTSRPNYSDSRLLFESMKLSDFDYPLPPERIAQTPLSRGTPHACWCSTARPGRSPHGLHPDRGVSAPGDLLVVNRTRVLPARLFVTKADTGGKVELLLLNRRAGPVGSAGGRQTGRRDAPGCDGWT